MSLANRFEQDAFVIDGRLGRREEVTFLWYCKGMRWTATDVGLFSGLDDYDISEPTDRFFTDQLRDMCRRIAQDDETVMGLGQFVSLAATAELRDLMRFFDGMSPDEHRPRWDRTVALHLLVMSFLNHFGYDRQRSDDSYLIFAAGQLKNPEVAGNLLRLLPQLGLQGEASDIAHALEHRLEASRPATA